MYLSRLLPPRLFKEQDGMEDKPLEQDSPETREELIRHHLVDIKKALIRAFQALDQGDVKELLDNIVLIQDGSMDAEEMVTGKEPKVE